MTSRRPSHRAFSVIELLVVIAIIALVVSITIPVLGHVRTAGRRAACSANLRMVGVALVAYQADHSEYPPATLIPLPWIAQRPLSEPLAPYVDSPTPRQLPDGGFATVAPWRCPSDPGLHMAIGTSYEYRLSLLAMGFEVDGVPNPWRAASARVESPADLSVVCDAGVNALQAMGIPLDEWHPRTVDGSRQSLFGDGRVGTIR